jgi:hypothetical protein
LALLEQRSAAEAAASRGGAAGEPSAVFAGLTPRALGLAVLLTVLAGIWIRQAEIVVLSTQISESIPAIPGLAALILLLGVNGLLRLLRFPRPLDRGELIVIFLFVTVSSTVMGPGIQRFLIALLGTAFYFPGLAANQKLLPEWLMPHDKEIMRQLYERAPSGQVPWAAWAGPALLWLAFFVVLWWTMYCLTALFYRSWAEEERLSFPLVYLPMEMTGGESRGFFRNPLMWGGFGIAAVYNLINIFHALNPSFPAIGKNIDLSLAFPDAPWSAVAPIQYEIRPELVGLGYLVSTEISFTVWVSFLLLKLAAVAAVAMGYPKGEMPYAQQQGMGAYLVLAVVAVWLSRRHLLRAWRSAWRGGEPAGPEGVSFRWLFVGLILGFIALWGFMSAAGMAGWAALLYLSVVLAVALVYARLRGEAGVPLVWMFPYYQQKELLLNALGSHPFLASGQSTLPAFALFTFLARGYYPAMTGYQAEAMELGRRARIDPRRIALALVLAVAVGFLVGGYNHLAPYYAHGAQNLRGGIWGTWISVPEYRNAIGYQTTPLLPSVARNWATVAGAGIALLLQLLRLRFTSFPLHPLGYVMTCSYSSLIWGPFFLVWVLKALALRWGGMGFYRTTVPFFLGLALGHFAIAGILWGLTGAWTGEAVSGYPVFFG